MDQDLARFYMVITGLIASIFYSSQLLVFKYLLRYTFDTFGIAFSFLFFSAAYGIAIMAYLIAFDPHTL